MFKQGKNIHELFNNEVGLTERQINILSAATELIAEKGFAATSTNEIAKKAGVAEGTIFRHYKTKKELLLSIVGPIMAKLVAPFVIEGFNKVLNKDYELFEDFLKAVIENRRRFLIENMALIRILIQEIPFYPELKEQFKEHVANGVFNRFRKIIEHYQAKGQLIGIPPETIIRVTGSTLLGYFITRYVIVSEENWDDEAEIERTIQFIMNGLAP